jgi:hypothetical protein
MPPAPKPKKKPQAKRFAHRRDPKYAAFVRSQPCILMGRSHFLAGIRAGEFRHICWNRTEACHVKSRGAAGSDRANLYPGCRAAHDSQHMKGVSSFGKRWGIDLKAEAVKLYARYLRGERPA